MRSPALPKAVSSLPAMPRLSLSLDQPCLKIQPSFLCSLAFLTTSKISQEKQAVLASLPPQHLPQFGLGIEVNSGHCDFVAWSYSPCPLPAPSPLFLFLPSTPISLSPSRVSYSWSWHGTPALLFPRPFQVLESQAWTTTPGCWSFSLTRHTLTTCHSGRRGYGAGLLNVHPSCPHVVCDLMLILSCVVLNTLCSSQGSGEIVHP